MFQSARLAAVMAIVVPLLAAGAVRAETDSGQAGFTPWSGYWWQHKSGGLTAPLAKYDRAFATRAAQWERAAHVQPNVPDWHGHCHAWSAACVTEAEPRQARQYRQTPLSVGDQKGLLTACHAMDVANFYGDRFGDGQGSEDSADLRPDELWRLLHLYLNQRHLPLICDLEPGEQVWNYPVSAYRIDYAPAADDWYQARLELVIVENDVKPDFVGSREGLHEFTFRFRMSAGAVVAGSGEWTGGSVSDHPDFAWYPYVAVAENPEIEFTRVSELIGHAVGGGQNPGDEPAPDRPERPTDDDRPANPPRPDRDRPDNGRPDNGRPAVPGAPGSIDNLLSINEVIALVANRTSQFTLDAFADLGDGGRYLTGQPVRISVRSAEPGFLYVFDVGPQGELRLVFPGPADSPRIEADRLYEFPVKGQSARLVAEGVGQHDLKVIVTERQLRLTGFAAGGPPAPRQASQQQGSPAILPAIERAAEQLGSAAQFYTLHLHPAAEQRARQQLDAVFHKTPALASAAPGKAGRFAQDQCGYFVLRAGDK